VESLSKDASWAGLSAAEPFADREVNAHSEVCPGQICECASVGTVRANGRAVAEWARALCLNGSRRDDDLVTVGIEVQGRQYETGRLG
jgi:hypothetical protein